MMSEMMMAMTVQVRVPGRGIRVRPSGDHRGREARHRREIPRHQQVRLLLHSVISLTKCIGIVWVGKYQVVCVSVCLSVCVSVGARTPKVLDRFQ